MARGALTIAVIFVLGCGSLESATQAPPPQATHEVVAPEPDHELASRKVKADDGHWLAIWEKKPSRPAGSIILLHGRTWSGRPDFDLQVPGEDRSLMDALVREGFAVYALDLRGYGATPRDKTGWNTPDRATRDLLTAVDWVSRKHPEFKPAVLGWSLGSLTAQLAAQRAPEKIGAVILYGYPRHPDRKYTAAANSDEPPPEHKTTEKAAAEDFTIPGSISKRAIHAFVLAALENDPVRADWRGSEEWNELDPAKVQVPTLLIHGAQDPYAPAKNQAALFERLGHPDREWVIVAGGDHAAHLENVGPRFVYAVVTFLGRPVTSVEAGGGT